MSAKLKLRLVLATARSATFEIVNGEPYRSNHKHRVTLNGKPEWEGAQNVFTLRDLAPAARHRIKVQSNGKTASLEFRTRTETGAVSVTDCGAIGDGKTDDTTAIQAAIACCPDGAVVSFPVGVWLSAPLFLKSNIELRFEKGASLVGHPDIARWPVIPGTVSNGSSERVLCTWEGEAADCHASLITGIDVKNVAITGEGVIDGNATNETWWSRPKSRFIGWRPRIIYFAHAKNIAIEGVTLRNSPSWTLHPFRSRRVTIANIKIEAPATSPNTDGINPDSCEDVDIVGCHISTGDDCVGIKSGKMALAKRDPAPSRKIRIANCLMENGHGAVVIGSETASGVYDVTARDCLFVGTDRGLRLKTRRGRGKRAIVDGISLRNVRMERVGTPFVINSFYWCDPDGKEPHVGDRNKHPVDDGTPTTRNVSLKNVVCSNVAHSAGYLLGLPERPIEDVRIENYHVSFDPDAKPGEPDMAAGIEPVAREGFRLLNVKKLKLRNVVIEGADGPDFIRENVK